MTNLMSSLAGARSAPWQSVDCFVAALLAMAVCLSRGVGFSRPESQTEPGLFDVMAIALAPLSTASRSRSLKISVGRVISGLVKKKRSQSLNRPAVSTKATLLPTHFSSMKPRLLTGTITALVTPFTKGQVSFADLKKLVEYQIRGGIDGLVPVGTTGESPTVTHEEHIAIIRATVEAARGRVPVIAGTGSNSTHEAVELTRLSHEAGADAMLVVAPYYNKPGPEGLFRHFCAVADSTDRPIIL